MGAVTLEHVAMEARPYPAHLLEGCETGLVLFAAAFLGHNDAVHFAEAGMVVKCVDIDRPRLEEMRDLYPDDWEWAYLDAWRHSEVAHRLGDQWDVVSLDPFTGDMMERSVSSLDLWCSLARKVVIVGYQKHIPIPVVPGWQAIDFMQRSSDVYWLVLTRD